jgi:hypothetical protein
MTAYRILSLDGGGIKGAFTASFLAALEEKLPHRISAYFDLICGTSVGGIIALGLGLGFTGQALLEFHQVFGREVFGGNPLVRWLRQWGIAKYSEKPLRAALERILDDRRLGEAQTRLVIPSLNLETGKVYLYKTAHHPRLATDYRVPAVDVAMATASASTYFPTHRDAFGLPLVDGGVWANNPVSVAVVEAITILGWSAAELRVLSVGCTSSPLTIGLARHLPLGNLYWARKIADLFMAAQTSASLSTAQLLAGKDNIFRIDPQVAPGRFTLDGIKELNSLVGLGRSEAREAFPLLEQPFFTQPCQKFEPLHRLETGKNRTDAPPAITPAS